MAGSKPGERRGGRQRGTPNKRTADQKAFLASVIGDSTGDPFLIIMNAIKAPDTPPDIKLKLCIEMMPYTRPKLASIEQREGGKSHEERLAELQRMLADGDDKPVALTEIEMPLLMDKENGETR